MDEHVPSSMQLFDIVHIVRSIQHTLYIDIYDVRMSRQKKCLLASRTGYISFSLVFNSIGKHAKDDPNNDGKVWLILFNIISSQ